MKRIFELCALLFLFLGLSNSEALATTRRVPADFPTIQQAINAAVNGDTVLVAAGIYVENITIFEKVLTIISESGRQVTIIDGNGASSVVTFASGAGASVLSGFTIRNGFSVHGGGGITIGQSSPFIFQNLIIDNSSIEGAGISISGELTAPIIQENIITGNFQDGGSGGSGGGGISITSSAKAQIIHNVISNNSIGNGIGGGGISIFGGGACFIFGNTIMNNAAGPGCCGTVSGGGIYVNTFTHQYIVQNLIVNNIAQDEGGGVWMNGVIESGFGVTLLSNTVADNDAPKGSGVFAATFGANEFINNIIVARASQVAFYSLEVGTGDLGSFRFNNVFAPNGMPYGGSAPDLTGMNGNISADPLFVNPSAGDYHLRSGSPSIDTGDNSAPNLPSTDLDGKPRIQDGNKDGVAIIDMGAYEFFTPFNACIQDDSGGSILQINTTTGDYQFTNCRGFTISGIGNLTRRGSTITLQHTAADRRVMAKIDGGINKATASIQILSQGLSFTLTDQNTANNTCSCR